MPRKPGGFWEYVEKWRKEFAHNYELNWEKYWIENGYCSKCRFCCGPQDSDVPFPMPLLPAQKRAGLEQDFQLLDSMTPYLAAEGCKSCGSKGCALTLSEKPLACGFFPIVLINGSLYLYKNCPAVIYTPLIRFLDLGLKVAEFLIDLDLADLKRLSLWLNCDVLSRFYIDLRIRIFKADTKELALE